MGPPPTTRLSPAPGTPWPPGGSRRSAAWEGVNDASQVRNLAGAPRHQHAGVCPDRRARPDGDCAGPDHGHPEAGGAGPRPVAANRARTDGEAAEPADQSPTLRRDRYAALADPRLREPVHPLRAPLPRGLELWRC